MTSKLSNFILKYFYYTNVGCGFVVFNSNFKNKTVKKSKLKILYVFFWLIFFVINFYPACSRAFVGFTEIYYNEATSRTTSTLEMFVSYLTFILISIIQLVTIPTQLKFFSKLFKLFFCGNFSYELFDDALSKQVAVIGIFGEIGVTVVFLLNLFWIYYEGVQNLLNVNPLENSILNVFVLLLPVTVFSRYSIAFAFFIDVIRKFLVKLNSRIEEALEAARSSRNVNEVHFEIETIDQIYSEVLSIIKLFERNFGWIVVILQCECLIVGIDQLFYFYTSIQLNSSVGLQQVSLVLFCSIHFWQLCLVFKLAKSLQEEGDNTRYLFNRFNFLPEPLPDPVEYDIELLKLHMIHNPIEIHICGMFLLNYFILYAIISSGAEYLIMLVQFDMAG